MSRLLNKTRQLLADRPRHKTYQTIAKDIDVSEHWLLNLATDKMSEPGVGKVERLYEYLSGRKLNV